MFGPIPLLFISFWPILRGVAAQEVPRVALNEVMWAKAEYIELVNYGDEDINLSGWRIVRQKPGDSEEDIVLFGTSDEVSAKQYFLIESAEDATSVSANKIKGSLGLIDGGVLLRLYNSEGVAVDTINQLGSWFAGKNDAVGASMERNNPSDDGTSSSSWHTSIGNSRGRIGTPAEENSPNSTPSPTPSNTPASSPSATPSTVPSSVPSVPPIYSDRVYINEFIPNPAGDDAAGEFIELYNASSAPIDISGWILDDVENGGSAPFTIPEGASIPANGYAVFSRTQTKISMNNDSDHVRLVRPDGVIQNDIAYQDLGDGISYSRGTSGDFQKTSIPTMGAENIIQTPKDSPVKAEGGESGEDEENSPTISYDFSSKIFINEILPNPEGSDIEQEFIELKSHDTQHINLVGWALDDGIDGSSPYRFSEKDSIAPGKFFVLFRSKTKLALNNDVDSVRLIDPTGKIVSHVEYGVGIVEGASYSRIERDQFVWTQKPTPGIENTIYVQSKDKDSPENEVIKKSTPKPKAQSRVRGLAVSVPRISPSPTPLLPWEDLTNTAKATKDPSRASLGNSFGPRQKIFIFGWMVVGCAQFLSGLSRKEAIWQK